MTFSFRMNNTFPPDISNNVTKGCDMLFSLFHIRCFHFRLLFIINFLYMLFDFIEPFCENKITAPVYVKCNSTSELNNASIAESSGYGVFHESVLSRSVVGLEMLSVIKTQELDQSTLLVSITAYQRP
jgi:hypothetical protein